MKDQITQLPGMRDLDGVQFSGYASMNGKHCKAGTDESLFYWFAGSHDYADRPTILWTNGGPGSSSFWGFFLENGPLEVGTGASWNPLAEGTVTARPTGWNKQANFLIFEHPLSVTLSVAKDEDNIPQNVGNGIEQLYESLQSFLDLHPEIRKQPLLIAGESYGGTYVPLLCQQIQQKNSTRTPINLRGQFIVSGWVNPEVQQSMDAEYAFTHGLLDEQQKVHCEGLYQQCKLAIDKSNGPNGTDKDKAKASEVCAGMENYIREASGRSYTTNILQEGDPSTVPVMTYLNREDVRTAIHAVSAKTYPITAFFSNPIYTYYKVGMQDSVADVLEELINSGLQTMITSGLDDGTDVNFMGVGKYLGLLKGEVFDGFRTTATKPWTVPSKKQPLGSFREYANFSWLKVVGGGHLSVRDQPKIIDKIMETFFKES